MTDDLVEACPSCYKSEIHERRSQSPRYRCLRCEYEFNEPHLREPIATTGRGPGTLANALDQLDPDDVPPRGDA